MMKYLILLFALLLSASFVIAQTDSIEFIEEELEKEQTVEARIDLLNKLSYEYTQLSLVSAEVLAQEALEKAIEINYLQGIATSYNNLGISHSIRGDYGAGLDYFIKALRLRESLQDLPAVSKTLNNIARVFHYQGDLEKAIAYSSRALELHNKIEDSVGLAMAHIAQGDIYLSMKDNASALIAVKKSREIFARKGSRNQEGWSLIKIANVLEADKKYDAALEACLEAKRLIDPKTDLFTTIELYQSMGLIYTNIGNVAEAHRHLYYAMKQADKGHDSNGSISSRLKLARMFREFRQYDSALYYMDAYIAQNEEAFTAEKSRQVNTLEKAYQAEAKDRLLELREAKIKMQSVIIGIITILLIGTGAVGFVIYRYYQGKKESTRALEKLNREIFDKHEEILAQSEELTQANEEIKRINESLEAEVTLRAHKIEEQNKKLIDYAYFNAHNVRGPLARIMGLSMLMERESAVGQLKEYTTYLITAAHELDNVIKEINLKLE